MSASCSHRASDAERDEAVRRLGDHAATGRLEPSELDERVAAALAARTRGELATVEADLPSDPPQAPPQPRSDPRRRAPRLAARPPDEVAAYLAVTALLVMIWALTGAGYFWPVWPALGWGVALMGPGHCGGGRRRRVSSRAARRA